MLQQTTLFTMKEIDLKHMLQHHATYNDKLFWTPREVSRILQLSGYQTYWLIWRCRLDALYVCGVYRIPWFCILDFLSDYRSIKRQFWAYKAMTGEADTAKVRVPVSLPTEEQDPEDYYCLSDLDIPDHITLQDLAATLRISPEALGLQYRWTSMVLSWPEVLDFLVECEVVNLPIFVDRQPQLIAPAESLQLALF